MATMTLEHTEQRSTLTVPSATARSRGVLSKAKQSVQDPSGYRVGSFHLPEGDARAVSTLKRVIGTKP